MKDRYYLPSRKARICRVAGAVFLVLAAASALGALSVALFPGPTFHCEPAGCRATLQPERLLEEDQHARVAASPVAKRHFDIHAARPIVRLGIGAGSLVENLPFALLLLSVGLALRRLGARAGDPLADALPWLRRGSKAAIACAVVSPVGNTLTKAVLSLGTPDGFILPLDFTAIGTALMLAAAAYASVWALEAGLKAQRDLDDFV